MGCYSELILLSTIEERLKYLQRNQKIGDRTFGGDRYLNQAFYTSLEWRNVRHSIVVRDNGCDLGIDGYPVLERGYIHHINPITLDQIKHGDDCLFDPENLILCSFKTHNAIHYGSSQNIYSKVTERRPGDTCPWR